MHSEVAQRFVLGDWSPMAGCATEINDVEQAFRGLLRIGELAQKLHSEKRLRADAGVNYARQARNALSSLSVLIYNVMWAVEDELGFPQ